MCEHSGILYNFPTMIDPLTGQEVPDILPSKCRCQLPPKPCQGCTDILSQKGNWLDGDSEEDYCEDCKKLIEKGKPTPNDVRIISEFGCCGKMLPDDFDFCPKCGSPKNERIADMISRDLSPLKIFHLSSEKWIAKKSDGKYDVSSRKPKNKYLEEE